MNGYSNNIDITAPGTASMTRQSGGFRKAYLAIAGRLGLLTALMAPSVWAEAPNGNGTFTALNQLELDLSALGIDLDATNTSKAAVLAVVQTIDAQARTITPEEWAILRNQREGALHLSGFRLAMSNGYPVVREVTAGSAAEEAGLAPGDRIIEIDTNRIERISLPDAQRLLRSSDAQKKAVRFVRGDQTNRVELTLARGTLPAIELAELLPNQMGYLKVNGLYPGSGPDLVSQIRAWSETGREGIILDLRGAGGGDESAILQTASLFAAGGQFLFAYRDFQNQDIQVIKASEVRPVPVPLMVLIDRETTGASETLAAVLNHAARSSLLIGETTAGDFNLREAVELGGHLVYVTTKVLDTADGWRYNGQFGVEPSVRLDPWGRDTHDYDPPADLLDRRRRLEIEERDAAIRRRVRGDGVLERAIDILIGLKALNKAPAGVSLPGS